MPYRKFSLEAQVVHMEALAFYRVESYEPWDKPSTRLTLTKNGSIITLDTFHRISLLQMAGIKVGETIRVKEMQYEYADGRLVIAQEMNLVGTGTQLVTTETLKKIPPAPGTREAIEAGCCCEPWPTGRMIDFIPSPDCPLH